MKMSSITTSCGTTRSWRCWPASWSRAARTARRWPANRRSTGSNWGRTSRRPITRLATTRRRLKIYLSICFSMRTSARHGRSSLIWTPTDDPLHGHQEGRFFHGYYDCYCYLPLYVFSGRHLLAAKLRRSNIDASAGAVEEVKPISHLVADHPTDADSPWVGHGLQPRCDIHPVAKDVLLLDDHVTKVDADPELNPLIWRNSRIALGHPALDLCSAAHGI